MKSLFAVLFFSMMVLSPIIIPKIVFAQGEIITESIEVAHNQIEFAPEDEIKTEKVVTSIDGDPSESIVALITNWKTMSPVAIGAAIILLIIQLLKTSFFGSFFKSLEWKRAFITILGILYGIFYLVSNGTSWVNALVVGLISSGGAVAIYQALKPLLDKKKAV